MEDIITLSHGSGGLAYRELVEEVIKPALASEMLDVENDSAVLPATQGHTVMTTDSFVIKPMFFPGGDIGRLAVCGTVNDLAVAGAKPLYLTSSFIIEAGFPVEGLIRICKSMSKAAHEAGIQIVTGDTKVVLKGACDGVYINTAGVGELKEVCNQKPQKGDLILISGNIGEHEAVIAAMRDSSVQSIDLISDVAPVNEPAAALFDAVPVLAMRDPTRGGTAAVLNEFAEKFNITIELDEEKLPISRQVAALCDLYGYEPLHMANEGKFIAIIPKAYKNNALNVLKGYTLCANACIAGEITDDKEALLVLKTEAGGKRIITTPLGELLPRIC